MVLMRNKRLLVRVGALAILISATVLAACSRNDRGQNSQNNTANFQLKFISQPQSAIDGATLVPVAVALFDPFGNALTSATSPVTVSLQNAGSASLSGTVTVSPVAGVASFSDLLVNGVGTNFSLSAQAQGFSAVSSLTFQISTSNPVNGLDVQVQPANGTVNVALNPAIEVVLVDAGSNVVATSQSPVTLKLGANPGQARLLGTTTAVPVNGIATFPDLRLDKAGSGFTLIASVAVIQTQVTTATFDMVIDNPDIVSLSVPAGALGGCVPITYSVAQAGSEKIEVLVEYDPSGAGTFFRASQAKINTATSHGVTALRSAPGPTGAGRVFLWNSQRDMGLASTISAQIRVTAFLNGQADQSMVLSQLSIQNNARFAASNDIATGDGPRSVAIADINRDGFEDLVVVHSNANVVVVQLQDPAKAGTYQMPLTVPVGTDPRSVAVADLNGDGRLDLAVANRSDGTVSVRFQDSTAALSFSSASDLTADTNPTFVVAGDLNRDGLIDLAVANEGSVVTIHLQDSNNIGQFIAAAQIDADSAPVGLALGDFNSDGFTDIAVANQNSNNLSVLMQNNGSPGDFLNSVEFAVGAKPRSIIAVDVDNDGRVDLLTANETDNNVSIVRQDPANPGSFLGAQNIAVGASPMSLVSADFNGDGRADIGTANQGAGTVSVLLQDHNNPGAFLSPQSLASAPGTNALAVGDLNRDGRSDIAAVNLDTDKVSILLNAQFADCSLDVVGALAFAVGNAPSAMTSADVNQDGRVDLVVCNNADATVTLLAGSGHGSFSTVGTLTTDPGPSAVTSADINGDGLTDLIVASVNSNTVTVFTQSDLNPGQFQTSTAIVSTSVGVVAAGFLDDDGLQDLVYTNPADNTVTLLQQDASQPGKFLAPVILPTNTNPGAVALANVNQDLFGDIAVANIASNTVTVFIQVSNSPGTFTSADLNVGSMPSALTFADFDGDGRLDLIVCNRGDNTLSVFAQDSGNPGVFLTAMTLAVGAEPVGLELVDVNADKLLDIIVLNQGDNSVSRLLQDSNSAGSFLGAQTTTLSGQAAALAAGDFTGNGRADLAALLQDFNQVQILRSEGANVFLGANRLALSGNSVGLAVGDFTPDGRLDLAAILGDTNNYSVSQQNAMGNFPAPVDVSVVSPGAIATGDVNGDGRLDLVIASANASLVTVATDDNQAPGAFVNGSTLNVGTNPSDVILADFNKDARLDIATCNRGSGDVSILLQTNNGAFSPAISLAVGVNPGALHSADLNGDGTLDLLVANNASNSLSLLLGDNANPGSFLAATSLATGDAPVALLSVDVNRDGLLDIVTALAAGQVAVSLQNAGSPGTFSGATTTTLPGDLVDIGAGDFNRDGLIDLAVANGQGVLLLLQDGAAPATSFVITGSLSSGMQSNAIALVDLNGNGRLDVVSSDGASSQLSIFSTR
jgi:hypothetical protein